MKSLFDKLCKTAFDMLKDNKLVIHEEEFGVVQDDLDSLQLKQFDGFGLYTLTIIVVNWLPWKHCTVLFIEQYRNFWQPFQ